jgi:hypothetical protein
VLHQPIDRAVYGESIIWDAALTELTFSGLTTFTFALDLSPQDNRGLVFLREHLRQWQEYGKEGYKVLQNGRIRYYGTIDPANVPGEMQGRRVVREWEPNTGYKRTWHETVDHNGRVRRVRPQENNPNHYHYDFDEQGNYLGRDYYGRR